MCSSKQTNIRPDIITAETIKRWKAKYPAGVYELTVSCFKGYVRLPTDGEMTKTYASSKKGDGEATARLLINQIWLGGDREIINNDLLFQAAAKQLIKIINTKISQKVSERKTKFF